MSLAQDCDFLNTIDKLFIKDIPKGDIPELKISGEDDDMHEIRKIIPDLFEPGGEGEFFDTLIQPVLLNMQANLPN